MSIIKNGKIISGTPADPIPEQKGFAGALLTTDGNKPLWSFDISRQLDTTPVIKRSIGGEDAQVMMVREDDGTWLAASLSGIWRSTDDGFTWGKTSNILASASVYPLGNKVWIAGGYEIEELWGSGESEEISECPKDRYDFDWKNKKWGIYRSADDGLTWSRMSVSDVQYPCPMTFAKATFSSESEPTIVAGLGLGQGAVYSKDDGLTWSGGNYWTYNIFGTERSNVSVYDIHVINQNNISNNIHPFSGNSLNDDADTMICATSINEYYGSGEFDIIHNTNSFETVLYYSNEKIKAWYPSYTSKTGTARTYWCNEIDSSIYCIIPGNESEIKLMEDCLVYDFIKLSDGYLYAIRYSDGALLKINDEGDKFELLSVAPLKDLVGYALATNSDKNRLVFGYYDSGLGTAQCPKQLATIDDCKEMIAKAVYEIMNNINSRI